MNSRLSHLESDVGRSEECFQNDRAGSAQSVMAAGGQCCLARVLLADDACALLLSDLLILGNLLGMPKLSTTFSYGPCRMQLASTGCVLAGQQAPQSSITEAPRHIQGYC